MVEKATSELLTRYAEWLTNSKNRNHYLSYASDFLKHSDGLSKVAIEQYLERLRKKGRKPGTVNFAFRVIRRLFVVNDLPWEFRRGEAPAIGERDEWRPQLSKEIVETIIQQAKSKLEADFACFAALSTVYGLRREEMVELATKDVDFANNAIYISTVKKGRQRYHLIPAEIKPYLEAHDFRKVYSLTAMSVLFNRILRACGLSRLEEENLGWHSIRRSILDGLINNGVNPFAARAFLRWKGIMGELAMPARYYGNVVMTMNGPRPALEEAKGDEEIFKKHPFLPMWGNKSQEEVNEHL